MGSLDNEIRDILTKILEGQIRFESKVTGLEIEAKKQSTKIETIEKNIKLILEVQTSHKGQHDFSFKNRDELIYEKTDKIETVVKNISEDVKEVIESVDVMKFVIGKHQIDIEILKRKPV